MTPVAKQSSVCNLGAKKFFSIRDGGGHSPMSPRLATPLTVCISQSTAVAVFTFMLFSLVRQIHTGILEILVFILETLCSMLFKISYHLYLSAIIVLYTVHNINLLSIYLIISLLSTTSGFSWLDISFVFFALDCLIGCVCDYKCYQLIDAVQ